jgi:hypothetical protein
MAVAFDAVGSSSNTGTGTLSYSVTIVSATNGAVFVGVGLGDAPGSGSTVTGVTFAGNAMTNVTKQVSDSNTLGEASLWSIVNTTLTGIQTIVVTRNGTPNASDTLESGAISFTGVDQTTPAGTPVKTSGTGTSSTINVTDSVSGDMCVDVTCQGSGGTWTSGQTNRWQINVNGSSQGGNGGGSTAPGGGTVAMSYTYEFSDGYALIAVSVKAAGAAAAPQPYQPWTGRAPILAA